MGAPRAVRHLVVVAAAAVVVGVPVGPVMAAADDDGAAEDDAPAAEAGTEAADVALDVTPVLADGPTSGDLRSDPGTGLATLTFTPDGPQTQRAVLSFDVTNTGQVDLQEIVVEADRIGSLPADVTSLAPGATVSVRGVLEITGAAARAGLAGLVPMAATVAATTPMGATVSGSATGQLQVVAVLAAPTATVALDVLPDAGDVGLGPGGLPAVTWSDEEAAADEPRRVTYRVVVTNTGAGALIDVSAVVELLGTALEVPVTATLEPGARATAEITHEVLPDDVVGGAAAGPVEAELLATATVTATDDGGAQPVVVTADAVVLGVVVRPLPDQVVLPTAGPPTRSDLALLAVLSIGFGVALLTAVPRRRVASRVDPA